MLKNWKKSIPPVFNVIDNQVQKGVKSITLDGSKVDGTVIPYSADKHAVEVTA